MQKPVLLCILDGVGVKKGGKYDAISQANTPNMDYLFANYPHSKVKTYGLAVGLPEGQMGNSEVGHMNIGGGRIVTQTLPKIDIAIQSGSLKNHAVIQAQITELKASGGSLHLMGLVSDGGVHAHIDHIIYLANIYAEAGVDVKIHAFTDGRDTAQKSAIGFITKLQKEAAHDNISIATIIGRFYAMDRDNRWERVLFAYEAIVKGSTGKIAELDKIIRYENPLEAIEDSYKHGKNDEFIFPTVNKKYTGMKDGDGILMANFRADRARELLDSMLNPELDTNGISFIRGDLIKFSSAVGMVDYSEALSKTLKTIFPSEVVANTLGEIISKLGRNQLRIAETEKYAHVTFFFNGGEEKIFAGEERIMVPSPKVATYDLQPEMSAPEVTEKLVAAIESKKFDLIVCNYANGDMVGHSGVLSAAIKAVEALDSALGKLKTAIEKAGGVLLVTADHGNVEEMLDEKGNPHTQHTVGDVPFIMVNYDKKVKLADGRLCDIAPTILEILEIAKPIEMNGVSLISA